jgi:hypothetical protein
MQEIGFTPGALLAGCVREYLLSTQPLSLSSSPCLQQTWQEQRAFYELAGTWLAEAVFRAGRQEDAVQLAKSALTQATASESIWFQCVAHTTLGRLLGQPDCKDDDAAEFHLLAGLRYAEAMQSRPLCVRALLALGEWLSERRKTLRSPQSGVHSQKRNGATNEKNRAREYLSRAADLSETLGMYTERERALIVLARLDPKSPRKRKSKV